MAAAVSILLMVLSVAVFMRSAPALAGSIYVETGSGYKSGDFGSPFDSHLLFIFSKAGYLTENSEFSVTAPFLFFREETDSGDEMNRGLGDVILRAGGHLIKNHPSDISFYGSVSVKLPTADQEKGLGTGETDYGVFLSVSKRFDRTSLWLTGGAVKVGSPPEQDLSDTFYYGIGVSRGFERLRVYLAIDGSRRILPESKAPLNANIGFFRILSPNYSVKGNAQAGLTESAPDFGISLSLVRFFY